MSSPDNPLNVYRLLSRAGVPFVIIGGHAVVFHGYLRTTEDADLIFDRSPASEAALFEALESIHACWISDQRDPATGLERLVPVSPSYVRDQHLMMLTTDLGFVDLYDYIPGFPNTPVADVFSDSIELNNLRFVSLRWLRKLKQAARRHKDLDDLEHLPSP
ncbi:MAG: hypothetical protein GX621_11535 [Pirellulaceae bacterium]|nr:hypothetical protein [Pirellulaceae bacterium]